MNRSNTRTTRRRVAVASALTLTSVFFAASTAWAHVAVTSPDATPGGEMALVSFRVPNESPTADTVKVTIDLPTDTPVASVAVQPLSGWTVSTTERTLPAPVKIGNFNVSKVPASVTWTASSGTSIGQDEFQIFSITLDPVPETDTVTFTATQTYSDGTVVKWNEPEPTDGSEAEHPAPVLNMTGGSMDQSASPSANPSPSDTMTSSMSPTPTASATPAATTDSANGGSSLPTILLIAALIVALAGFAVAISARRSRS